MSKDTFRVSKQQLKIAQELIGEGHSIASAARHAGMSRHTIMRYQEKGLLPYPPKNNEDPDPGQQGPVIIATDLADVLIVEHSPSRDRK